MTDIVNRMRASSLAIVVATTSLGFVVVQLDTSIVNVALARMGQSLGVGVDELQWVIDAYTLAFAALLLLAGALGDRYGARRVFVAGMAAFTTASLVCGLAPQATILIAARAAQGAGAAFVMPSSLALLNHTCGGDRGARARAVGLWTAAGGAALSAGVVLGGLMVQGLGWRSIFLVNLPVGCLAVWLALSFLEETEPQAAKGFDWPGQVLAVIALYALTGAMIEAGLAGWSGRLVVLGLCVAAAASAAFVVTEATSAQPLLPLRLFRKPPFSVAILVGLAVNLTVYGAIFVLSFYFQETKHYSPAQAGLALLPFMALVVISNVLGGRVSAFGTRRPLILGLGLGALGFALTATATADSAYLSVIVRLGLIPIGIGFAVPAMTTMLLASVDKTQSGLASGVLNTVRQAAGAIGVAGFGALIHPDLVAGMRVAFFISAALLVLAALFVAATIRED